MHIHAYITQDHIDRGNLDKSDIDARLISRLLEVPTPTALAAVERFGRCDFNGVRSRAGFLMGIVRRMDEEMRAPPRRYDDRRDDRYGGGRRDDRDRYGGGGRYRSRSRSPRRRY